MTCPRHGRFEVETGFDCPICDLPMVGDHEILVYSDGGGWNGRFSVVCVVDEDDCVHYNRMSRNYTNNEAEYLALIQALSLAPSGSVVCLDSLLVVNQMRGVWQVRSEHLNRMHRIAFSLWAQRNVRLVWVPRDENLAGVEIDCRKGRVQK